MNVDPNRFECAGRQDKKLQVPSDIVTCKLQFLLDPVSAHCQAALGSVMKGTLTCEKLPGHKCFIKRLLELPIFQSTQDSLKCCQLLFLENILSWPVCDMDSGNAHQV